jgi:hypothetical protein
LQKREEMEKRRKEARRPRALESRLWELVLCARSLGKRQEIEDEKAKIRQELASLGWTMEAKLAGAL